MTPDTPDSADNASRVEEPAAAYKAHHDPPAGHDPAVAGAQTVGRLRDAGFDRAQAQGVVVAVRELAGDLSAKVEVGEVRKDVKRIQEDVADLKLDVGGMKGSVATVRQNVAELKADNRILKAGLERVEETMASMAATMATKDALGHVEKVLPTFATKDALALVQKDVEHIKETMATKADLALVQKDVEHIKSTMVTEEVLAKRLMSSNRWTVGIVIGVIVAAFSIGVSIILNALPG